MKTPMNEELFDIPESLSPRLKWMRYHDPRVKETRTLQTFYNQPRRDLFVAWFPINDEYVPEDDADIDEEDPEMRHTGEPDKTHQCGFGDTEEDALIDLCRVTKTKHWSQE